MLQMTFKFYRLILFNFDFIAHGHEIQKYLDILKVFHYNKIAI